MQNVKKTYKLFLDDIRDPIHAFGYTRLDMFLDDDWIIVRDYTDFVATIMSKWDITKAFPSIVAFDHDLADEHYRPSMYDSDKHYNKYYDDGTFIEKTGYDCAKWLIDFCIDNKITLPIWICHSMNPAGRDNINGLLTNFKKHQDGMA